MAVFCSSFPLLPFFHLCFLLSPFSFFLHFLLSLPSSFFLSFF
jgi:hypothetical protein